MNSGVQIARQPSGALKEELKKIVNIGAQIARQLSGPLKKNSLSCEYVV